MEPDNQVNRMDEELKLLKNEIKQVLLEVQEHVLSAQNPFTSVVGSSGGGQIQDMQEKLLAEQAAALKAPTETLAREPQQQTVAPQPQPQQPMVAPQPQPQQPMVAPQPQPQQPMVAPQPQPQQQVIAPQGPQPGPGSNQMESFEGVTGPGPQFTGASERRETPDGTPPGPKAHTPPKAVGDKRSSKTDKQEKVAVHQQNEKTAPSESRDIQESSGDHRSESEEELDGRHEVEDVLDQPAAHHDRPDGADEGDGEDLRDQDGPRRGRSADTTGRSSVTPSAKRKDQPESMDLITLSGLAQWTDRVLKKAGREYIEALLDISEVTGRLSVQRKETILTLVRLLEDRGSGNGLKAREMISMLAQLDGSLGNGTPADVRLLPLLLEDDPEVFRLTQR